MTLKHAIEQTELSLRKLEKSFGMSSAAISRLVNYGEFPARRKIDAVKRDILAALGRHGVTAEIEWPEAGIRPGYGNGSRRERRAGIVLVHHGEPAESNVEAINLMQLDRKVLEQFALRRNPFINDVQDEDDVFAFKGHQAVANAIHDAIEERGFLAIAAPSGAGKTTIWDGIESDCVRDESIVICRPMLKDKEKLNPEHLCRALIYGLQGEDARVKQDAEDRGRQLSNALRSLRTGTSDRKAVLVVDDAHFASTSVLRQLKTFYEEKIGRYRLLTIILIGLPKLKSKLADFPEIGNRIRLVEVPPVPVEAYLRFKLARVGSSPEKLFDAGGLDAFIGRFRQPRKAAVGYPLIINATCIRAMVKLLDQGAQPGERITREIVDLLPSEERIKAMANAERAA